MAPWPIAGGLALTAAGWLAARFSARAPVRLTWALPLDLAAPFGLWAILFAASARPWFAGAASLAVFVGFTFADTTKRATLREPVVFSDMSEFIELFRHPDLYLPFAGTGTVIGGALAIAVALASILVIEPAEWTPWSPWPGLIALAIVLGLILATSRPPLLGVLAALARRARPSTDPARDAMRFGPLAMLPIHGVIARAERPARRAAIAAPMLAVRPRGAAPPIVMLQCESFFDARRLHPAIPRDLLPVFDECARTGIQAGRFGVSGWGAYTVRAEFAALTGLGEAALGYDRWNPYHAFVGGPIPSLAARLRAEGYRTLCLHPFDRSYYRRHKVLPRLGFDAFIGEEAFAGARRIGPFVADTELARRAVDILEEDGRGLFLFVITMENHGPWLDEHPGAALPDPAPDLPNFAGKDELRRYLQGIRHTDAMLGTIRDWLRAKPGGLLAVYGDHLPSLPGIFEACGFDRADTDYAIWRAGGGAGARLDLAAHELPAAIWAARAALA